MVLKCNSREDHQGLGRILVMDDEELVSDIIKRILIENGYRVDYACDGEIAVSLFRLGVEIKQPYDVVILDLTVPGGKGGLWTINKLRMIESDLVAILTSGYHDAHEMVDYTSYGFRGSLQKPFRAVEVVDVVRKVILGLNVGKS